jgi:hypothetical protein
MSVWRQAERITVPDGGSATFTLAPSRPLVLNKLTIWATTGQRVLTGDMTFQARINGKSLGSLVTVASGVTVNDVIYVQGGDESDNLIPQSSGAPVDPFVFDILISNAAGTDMDVSIYAAAVG